MWLLVVLSLVSTWVQPAAGLITLTGGWQATEWGLCEVSAAAEAARGTLMPTGCTAGQQKRTVTCGLANGVACIQPEPVGLRTCGRGDVCGYALSSWGPCDAPCGGTGKQTRLAYCVAPTLPGACKTPVPVALEQNCQGEITGCDWYRSDWRSCSNTCGRGHQSRHVACLKIQGCSETKPIKSRECEGRTCSWTLSEWSGCTGACGQSGLQSRTKTCPIVGACASDPETSQSCIGSCPTPAPTPAPAPYYPLRALNNPSQSTATTTAAMHTTTSAASTSSSGSGDSSVPKYSWYVGSWGDCKGNCGQWKYRERKVWCMETCSVPLACPQVEDEYCTSLYTTPPSLQDCGQMTPCTSSSFMGTNSATTTTSLAATTRKAVSPVTTPAPSPPSGGTGTTVTLDPADWECLVVLGQKASSASCLTGADASVVCGAGCPCCRRKPKSGAGTSNSGAAASTAEDGGTDVIPIVIGAVSGAGFLLALGFACGRLNQSLKAAKNQGLNAVHEDSGEFAHKYGHSSSFDSRSRKDAWGDHFELPPEFGDDIPGSSRVAGDVGSPYKRRENEDDSTTDSDHEGDDRFSSRRPSAKRAERDDREETSRRDPPNRSQTSQSTARVSGEPPKRAATTPVDGKSRDASRKGTHEGSGREKAKNKTAAQAAAEAAFDEGLGAGKAKEREYERQQDKAARDAAREAKKPKRSASTRSAHPKGTAVPPRPRDTDTEPPHGSSSASAGNDGQQSTHSKPEASSSSSSAPPPPSSADNSKGPPPSNTQEAKADDGAATMVNEHVLKLDAELDSTRSKDLEFRRKNFKTMLLKWHPDKNTGGMGEAESSAQANEVFKHLLARRDRYLAE